MDFAKYRTFGKTLRIAFSAVAAPKKPDEVKLVALLLTSRKSPGNAKKLYKNILFQPALDTWTQRVTFS